MRNIFFVLLVFLISSCESKNDFNDNLTDNELGNVWILKTLEDNEYSYTDNQLKFEADGTCTTYISRDENRMGAPSSINVDNRDIGKSTWKYETRDSTLRVLDSYDYKVIRYSKDSVVMEGNGYDGRFLLVRMKR